MSMKVDFEYLIQQTGAVKLEEKLSAIVDEEILYYTRGGYSFVYRNSDWSSIYILTQDVAKFHTLEVKHKNFPTYRNKFELQMNWREETVLYEMPYYNCVEEDSLSNEDYEVYKTLRNLQRHLDNQHCLDNNSTELLKILNSMPNIEVYEQLIQLIETMSKVGNVFLDAREDNFAMDQDNNLILLDVLAIEPFPQENDTCAEREVS